MTVKPLKILKGDGWKRQMAKHAVNCFGVFAQTSAQIVEDVLEPLKSKTPKKGNAQKGK